jgi:hypothetical protein
MKESNQAIFCMRFDLATPSDPLAFGELVLGRYKFPNTNEVGIIVKFPQPPNIIWHTMRFID